MFSKPEASLTISQNTAAQQVQEPFDIQAYTQYNKRLKHRLTQTHTCQ